MRVYGSAHLHSQVDAVCNGTTVSLALTVDNSLWCSASLALVYGSAHIYIPSGACSIVQDPRF